MCFCIIAFWGSNNFLCAQEIAECEELYQKITIETLNPYFKALKNGDVSSIKLYISEEMYKRYKVLLENNKDYPGFLRNYYQGVDFRVKKLELVGNDIAVSAILTFHDDNESLNPEFLLQKKMDDLYPDVMRGRWKVKEREINKLNKN